MAEKRSNTAKQDYPLGPVPASERKNMWSTALVMLNFTLYVGTMYGGGLIGSSFDFKNLMTVILIGNLLLGIYVAILGYIAFKTGLNTSLLARMAMGVFGSKIADFIFLFTQLGWSGWGAAMIAITFMQLASLSGTTWFIVLACIVACLYATTSFIGYKGLDILSRIAAPAILILIFLSLGIGLKDAGGIANLTAITPTGTMSYGVAITIIIGTYISGGTNSTNWTRWAKTSKIAVLSALLAFFLGNGLMVLSGAFGALVYQQNDMVLNLATQGLLGWGIVLLIANTWTSQDHTYYICSVAACSFFQSEKRRMFVGMSVVAAIILALSGVYNWMESYLVLAGTFIPPVGGIIFGDFFFRYKMKMPDYTTVVLKKANWSGICAYFVACAIAYFSPGIPIINGIVSAVILYPVFDFIFKAVGRPQAHQIKDADEGLAA